jgi:hypothetical protein
MERSFVETVARRENFLRRGFRPSVALQTTENNFHLHITSLGSELLQKIATVDIMHIQRKTDFIYT